MEILEWLGTRFAIVAVEGSVGTLRLSRALDVRLGVPRLLLSGDDCVGALAPRIHTPGLLRVVDSGDTPLPWIAHEQLAGVSLREVVTQGREMGGAMPVEAAAHVVARAARGAHALLRDHFIGPLTSAHVRVGFDGEAVLVGVVEPRYARSPFGNAQPGEDPIIMLPPPRWRRSQPVEPWLAPEELDREHARERATDAASEVFRAGALLQLLLDGEHPFADDHPMQSLERLQQERRRPLRREVPEALRIVVERALDRDPGARFADLAALAAALEPLAGDDGRAATSALASGMFPRMRAEQLLEIEQAATIEPGALAHDAPTVKVPSPSPPRITWGRGRVSAATRLATNADVVRFLDATGAADPPSFVGRIPELADEPAVLLGPADAAAYARWCGGRLPTEAEWSAVVEDVVLPDVARIWEWTSTPMRTGFVVRGGPWRNIESTGHVDHRSWEDEPATDVGLRVFFDE